MTLSNVSVSTRQGPTFNNLGWIVYNLFWRCWKNIFFCRVDKVMVCDLAAAVMSLISYRSAFDKLPETAHLSWVRLCSVFFENLGTLQPSGNDVYPVLFSDFRNLMVKGWSNRSTRQWGSREERDPRRCGGFSCSHSTGLVDKTRWGLLPLENETSLSWTDFISRYSYECTCSLSKSLITNSRAANMTFILYYFMHSASLQQQGLIPSWNF